MSHLNTPFGRLPTFSRAATLYNNWWYHATLRDHVCWGYIMRRTAERGRCMRACAPRATTSSISLLLEHTHLT